MLIPVSIFDVDRTLTKTPTYFAFLVFGAKRIAPWRRIFIPLVMAGMLAYKAGLVSRKGLKQFMQARLLGPRISLNQANDLAAEFATLLMKNGLYPQAMDLVKREASDGRRVILATASHHFYIDTLAAELGIADVVATASVRRGEALTAKIDGENCYGEAKRDMVAALFMREGLARDQLHIRFFSDDISDLPLFEWVDEAVAVNPSFALQAHAGVQGWPVLDWR
jgi:HAD superfamily hydrolase (TIGR01490 family)